MSALRAARVGDHGEHGFLPEGLVAVVERGLAYEPECPRVIRRVRWCNHTNYAPPATNVSSPSRFGVFDARPTAENAGNLTGQLALRFDLHTRLTVTRSAALA